jgi:polyisoprenoid-binding protein YceI
MMKGMRPFSAAARTGALVALTLFAVPQGRAQEREQAVRYALSATESRFDFSIGHFVVSSTEGRFTSFDGTLTFPRDAPERGQAVIHVATASIDTGIAARDQHLRTADFFDAAQFPTATFQSGGLTHTGPAGRLTGQLTLHGVTRPISLDAALKSPDPAGDRLDFAVTGTIKRSDFGMKNYMGMIGDDVTLTITAVFHRQPE